MCIQLLTEDIMYINQNYISKSGKTKNCYDRQVNTGSTLEKGTTSV